MSDINARYLGLTANQLAKIATDLKAEVLLLRKENAGLRKECDTLCHRIDELCMEVERLRRGRTARRLTVYNHDTDCATGHSECSECHGTVNPCARFCEHCGALFKEGE